MNNDDAKRPTVLITGSAGMIGRHLQERLRTSGFDVRGFDISSDPRQDIRDRDALAAAMEGVDGIVHLAAISRVAWGERDPTECFDVNVHALETLAELCLSGPRPWLVFSSSREVYGSATRLPVAEDAPRRPVNVYGRSKLAGEAIVEEARKRGLVANICRLSNVYGCAEDHPDRVARAFAATAASGGVMSVVGGANRFDFTTVGDVVDGLYRLIESTSRGMLLPPIHFASGVATSIRDLAELAARHARHPVKIEEQAGRPFDVSGFVGDPRRAEALLGWRARDTIETGMAALVSAFAPTFVA